MSRTVFCPEEVIVVSKGKEDIGKLVELGNDGKFDTSVIPMVGDLQDQVTAEATARSDADKQLQNNIDTEATARDATDKDLQDQISKEIVARTDVDTALQSSVDKEVAARNDADSKLQSSIDAEVDARTKADQSLQDQVTAEIAARTNAVETESNTRASAVQELLNKIDALIKTKCVPTGVVEYFAITAAPEGWLEANGSAVSRTQYADLFAAVGTMFGTGDGSTTFNLPDLRGEFIRGFDNGRGIDSERTFGSWQKPSLVNGDYNENKNVVSFGGLPQNRSVYGWEDPLLNGHIASDGYYWWVPSTTQGMYGIDMRICGVTRPRNISLLACIKY